LRGVCAFFLRPQHGLELITDSSDRPASPKRIGSRPLLRINFRMADFTGQSLPVLRLDPNQFPVNRRRLPIGNYPVNPEPKVCTSIRILVGSILSANRNRKTGIAGVLSGAWGALDGKHETHRFVP
jgi:hypothetical protein